MGTRKPTLGYPSRTAAVVALVDQGKTHSQVAELLGLKTGTVSALTASYRRRNGRVQGIPITGDSIDLLRPDAVARGISIPEIIRRIIEVVAEERMVDAVLDDGCQP